MVYMVSDAERRVERRQWRALMNVHEDARQVFIQAEVASVDTAKERLFTLIVGWRSAINRIQVVEPENICAQNAGGGLIFRATTMHRLGAIYAQAHLLLHLHGVLAEFRISRWDTAKDGDNQNMLPRRHLHGNRSATRERCIIEMRLKVDMTVVLVDLIERRKLHGCLLFGYSRSSGILRAN